jgi:hypothetical protein
MPLIELREAQLRLILEIRQARAAMVWRAALLVGACVALIVGNVVLAWRGPDRVWLYFTLALFNAATIVFTAFNARHHWRNYTRLEREIAHAGQRGTR